MLEEFSFKKGKFKETKLQCRKNLLGHMMQFSHVDSYKKR